MKYKILFIWLFCTRLLLAQTQTGTPPPTDINLKFRTIGVGLDATDLFYMDKAGKPQPITISSESRSPYYEYKHTGGSLIFVRMVPDKEGKPVPQSVAEVNLVNMGNRALVIFSSKSLIYDATTPVSVMALNDTVKDVPPGGYRIINFLPAPAGIRIGEQKQILQPGEIAIFRGEVGESLGVNPVNVAVIIEADFKPIYGSSWPFFPSQRHLVIIARSQSAAIGAEVKLLSESATAIPE